MKTSRRQFLMSLVIGLIWLTLTVPAFGAWSTIYEHNGTVEVAQIITGSDGIYVAGTVNRTGNANIVVNKYNFDGSLAWPTAYEYDSGGGKKDEAYGLAQASGGRIVVVGATQNPTTGWNWKVICLSNSDGHMIWNKAILSDYEDKALCVAADDSDNVYVAGYVTANDGYDFYQATEIRKWNVASKESIWMQYPGYQRRVADTPMFIRTDNLGSL